MALPKVNDPTFSIEMPVTKKKVEFRPFKVKEEKMLLVAMESGESEDIINSIKNVLSNCVISNYDIEKAPSFEIEYLFLQLRGKSVGEEITLNLKHPNDENQAGEKCDHIQEVSVNIDDIQIDIPKEHTNVIHLTDELGVVMKYPSLELADAYQSDGTNEVENTFKIIMNSIESIFDKDEVYMAKDHTEEEMQEFLESLNHKQFEKLSEFFETMPTLKHTIEYKCEGCGEQQVYHAEGLENFF